MASEDYLVISKGETYRNLRFGYGIDNADYGSVTVKSGGLLQQSSCYGASLGIDQGGSIKDIDFSFSSISCEGTASGLTVHASEQLDPYQAGLSIRGSGSIHDVTVEKGGNLAILKKTTVKNITLDGGYLQVTGSAQNITSRNGSYLDLYGKGGASGYSDVMGNFSLKNGFLTTQIGRLIDCTIEVTSELNVVGQVVGNNAIQDVYKDGAATRTQVLAGGCQKVGIRCVANDTVVRSGGSQYVSGWAGVATANRTVLDAGAVQQLVRNAVANQTLIHSGGLLRVESSSTVRDARIEYGGNLVLGSAPVRDDFFSASANLDGFGDDSEELDKITLTGHLRLAGTITVEPELTTPIDASQATIVFDLAKMSTADPARVERLDLLSGANYAVSIAGEPAGGLYRLAAAASEFSGTVTVTNAALKSLGKLSLDAPVFRFANQEFTLALDPAGELTLQVKYAGGAFIGSGNAALLPGTLGDDIFHFRGETRWGNAFSLRQASDPTHSVSLAGDRRNADTFGGKGGFDRLMMTEEDDALILDDPFSAFAPGQAPGPRLIGIAEIHAGDGNDLIDLSSNRYLYGDVRIFGEEGDDTLWSNAGNDLLWGGAGDDMLDGGSGKDVYVFEANWGNDTLADPDHGGALVFDQSLEGSLVISADRQTVTCGENTLRLNGPLDDFQLVYVDFAGMKLSEAADKILAQLA